MGVFKPDAVMRNMLPVIMAGILGIYGLIASIIMVYSSRDGRFPSFLVKAPNETGTHYSSFNGYGHLAAGLSCGLSCLAAGLSIGIAGDAGVRACGQQEKIFVGMILMLIFGEALALYGLIVAIVIVTVTNYYCYLCFFKHSMLHSLFRIQVRRQLDVNRRYSAGRRQQLHGSTFSSLQPHASRRYCLDSSD